MKINTPAICRCLAAALAWGLFATSLSLVRAQQPRPVVTASPISTSIPTPTPEPDPLVESTAAAMAASESARQLVQEKTDQDLTVPTSQVTGTLTEFLDEHPVTMKGWNVLQVLIHRAVAGGLPANMVVLLLLFPVIATAIAFSRYVIGITGFGVYTPAVITVALISLSVPVGILIFLIVLFGVLLIKYLLRRLPVPNLSKTALTLWGISLLMLFVSLVTTYLGFSFFLSVGIFPILILILLSEDFTDSQFFTNTRTAFKQTASTLVLASVCALPLRLASVQRLVIMNPEIMIVFTLLVNLVIGRYHGLRWLERIRFQTLLKEK